MPKTMEVNSANTTAALKWPKCSVTVPPRSGRFPLRVDG
jgi:hypothetical protein